MATLRTLTDLFNPEIAVTRNGVFTPENGPALTGRILVTDPSLLGIGSSGIASFSVTPGQFGTLALSADRNASADVFDVLYTYTPTASLRGGQIVSDVFLVTARDGSGRTVQMSFSLAVTGVNDNPVLSAVIQPATVVEVAGTSATPVAPIVGSLNVTDADIGDTLTAQVVGSPQLALSGAGTVPPALAAVLLDPAAFTLGGPVVANGNNQAISFTYNPAGNDLNLNFLAQGQTLTVTYQVRVADDSGGASQTRAVTFTFAGTNDAPVLTTPVAVTLVDSGGNDDFTTAPAASNLTGTLAATDVDGSTFTYGITGVTPAVDGTATAVGQYGTLVLNTLTGAYTFTANDAAVEDLDADTAESFTVTVTDAAGATASQSLDINITAVNDGPVLGAPAATVQQLENGGLDQGGGTNLPALTGMLSVSDAEVGNVLTASVLTAQLLLNGAAITPANAGIGQNAINDLVNELITSRLVLGSVVANGGPQTINYTYNAANANLNFLREGAILSVVFNVQVADGSGGLSAVQPLTFTVRGTNDSPELQNAGVDIAILAMEAGNASAQTISGMGSVTLTDRDRGDALSVTTADPVVLLNGVALTAAQAAQLASLTAPGALVIAPAAQPGTGGNIVFNYSYSATADLDFLDDGDSLTISYALSGNDGTGSSASRNLVITIAGTNDGPQLQGIDPIVYNDTENNDTFNSVAGTVVATDLDDTVAYGVVGGVGDINGNLVVTSPYGALTLNPQSGAYTFVPDDAALEGVSGAVVVNFSFTITATDGTASDAEPLSIVINGANDIATFSGTVTGAVTEDDLVNTLGGTVIVDDRDDGEDGFQAVAPAALVGTYGDFTFNDLTGAWTYTLDNGRAATNGLAAGATEEDLLTITSTGGTTQVLTVTVTGNNDAPVLLAGPVYTEAGVSFTVDDPDDSAILTLNPPLPTFFADDTINDGTTTMLLVQAQSAVASSALTVADESGQSVGVGYLVLGSDSANGGVFGLSQSGAVYGFGGNDTITGSGGDDFMFGGADNDSLTGGAGNDFLVGGTGNDVLNGGMGNDSFIGGAGNDTINGGNGIDVVIFNGNRADYTLTWDGTTITAATTLVGQAGTDTITNVGRLRFTDGDVLLVDDIGAATAEVFNTIQSAVNASGTTGGVLIASGTYNENVTVTGKGLTLDGAGRTGVGATTVNGQITVSGTLNNVFRVQDVAVNAAGQAYGVFVDAGSTALAGSVQLDNVSLSNAGENGFGYIRAGNGSAPTLTDTVGSISITNSVLANNSPVNLGSGGRGDIILFGYNGNLTLDTVDIAAGANGRIGIQMRGTQAPGDVAGTGPYAAAGNLLLNNLTIHDANYGAGGIQLSNIASFASSSITNVNFTNVSAGFGLVSSDGVGGALNFSAVTGTNGSMSNPFEVVVQGLASTDTLSGSATGDSFLNGRAGNDVLTGGGGADRLTGGAGADQLTGGGGADAFGFLAGESNGVLGQFDTITDFAQGLDKIDLNGAGVAIYGGNFNVNGGAAGVIASFAGGFAANSVFTYTSDDGNRYFFYDATQNGNVDANDVFVRVVGAGPALNAGDFV
ncbi:MAG: VCBS domain-containing protein [Pseudomonadota bacterium]